MSDPVAPRTAHPRSSRARYRVFVRDYTGRRLDSSGRTPEERTAEAASRPAAARRKYVRDYLTWLQPHRAAIAFVLTLAFASAGLQMIEPLFMRFIIDRARDSSDGRLGRRTGPYAS
jgi:ATP-binding cassette subfamily B protein/subfamily B ATP-binding cassette protein MsbA